MNFFNFLNPNNLPEAVRRKDVLTIQREVVLQTIYNVLLVVCSLGFIYVFTKMPDVFRSGRVLPYLMGILILVALTMIRRIYYNIRAVFLIIALLGLSASALSVYGLSGTGIIFLFAAILLEFILFDNRIGIFLFILGFAQFAVIGWGMTSGKIPLPPIEAMANSGNPNQWVTAGIVLLLGVGITTSSILLILRRTNQALRDREILTRELEREQDSLEQRVEERSTELKQKVAQFEIASQIAREISGETDLNALLNNAVNLIRDRFGYYHVGVFLNDSKNEFTVLSAATGEAGRALLERSHRLKIGEIGLVGYVADRSEARISMNVSRDAVHYKNPLLPDTRSEMALPLRAGDHTIGALDVQSILDNAFSQEDVQVLQTIADQMAIAFEKTRLVNELKRTVSELEAIDRAATQKAWHTHLKNKRQKLAYTYHQTLLEQKVDETPHAQEAMEKGQPVLEILQKEDASGKPVTVLAVPIKLRNQVLGVVDIHFDGANISPDLISLIEGTVNRLAISLENARLLEEIQFRAERERMVSEISSKVRAAADVDSVLRIAVQEIGQSLGVSEVMVQLRKDA